MAEITFEITKELGVISETARGWTRELNMVSWNDHEPKYDIRDWSPDHTRMSKGVSLTEEEMQKLCELFAARDEEDSFE
ncbi:MAG: YdbC family protein [Oscillospiraceae bacterium]